MTTRPDDQTSMKKTEYSKINMNSKSVQDEAFIFRGRRFIKTTWNGLVVIKDELTGYYQASKACKDNGKRINNWLRNKDTQDYLNTASVEYGMEIFNDLLDTRIRASSLIYKIKPGKDINMDVRETNELQGYYIHPDLFHDVCYWANKPYAVKVSRLMNLINEHNRLLNQTLEQTIAQYEEENNKLKREKGELENQLTEKTLDYEFLSFDVSKLQAQVEDLNTPINQSIQPSSIYASPVGKNHFQLRYSREAISKNSKVRNLKHVEMINAKDVLEMTRKEIKKSNEASKLNGKVVIPTSKLDQTFDLISNIKEGTVKLPTQGEINSFIDKAISDLKLKRLTPQLKGKIFELEQLKQGNYIPWSLIPSSLINKTNEQARDCGIDGLRFKENSIEEIVQIKFHNKPSYLNFNEIKTFINKCNQDRYKNIKKTLILHGCKLGMKLKALIQTNNITIENA